MFLRDYDLSKAFPGSISPCEDTVWVNGTQMMSKMVFQQVCMY